VRECRIRARIRTPAVELAIEETLEITTRAAAGAKIHSAS